MMKRSVFGLSLAGLVWVVSGCGGGSSDEGPPPGPSYTYPDVTSFCDGWAEAECGEQLVSNCVTDSAACLTKRSERCSSEVPPGSRYRAGAADACIAAIAASYDDARLAGGELVAIDIVCDLVFGGNGGAGAPCADDFGCDRDSSLHCLVPAAGGSGTCQLPVAVENGADCSAPDAVCAEASYCDTTVDACLVRKAAGAPCSDTQPCAVGLRCDGPAGATVCTERLAAGEACASDDQCATSLCSVVADEFLCVDAIFFTPNEPSCAQFR